MTETYPRLIADIGGTNARFALQRDAKAPITDLGVQAASDHPSLQAAIQAYLADHPDALPTWGVIGIATPVAGDHISMTNHHWSFSIAELKRALQFERLLVINDFTALALALPVLDATAVVAVGSGRARPEGAMALLGPGTGLGVGGLARQSDRFVPIVGEGGHVTLAAATEREAAVIAHLRHRFGHASAERALSGQGLINLYDACCALDGRPAEIVDSADVTRHALASGDPHCSEAVALFFSFLGTTAGNLALTLGAFGGVYIGGGIVPRLLPLIDKSDFRSRFECKGRFADYLKAIPTCVIDCDFPPALTGAARAFETFD